MGERLRLGPGSLVGGLALAALGMSVATLALRLPPALWIDALASPDPSDVRQMLVRYSFAPRLATSLLCGGALGLAGALMQIALRNPLASPTTLGVSAGANLALAMAMLWAPGLLAVGREWTAMAGGLVAALLVLGLSWRRRLSPLTVVLAGMVVSLYCGALAAMLALFNSHYLAGLFIWGGGSLSQQDWTIAQFLTPRLALALLAAALLVRPLTLLTLEDDQAKGLGLSVPLIRLATLVLAVALTGLVVGTVGVIGFIGLAAPALVTVAGARRVAARLLWSTLLGAVLLWLTDQSVLRLAGDFGEMLPTGAITALIGSPLLLWLIPRLRLTPQPPTGLGEAIRRPGRPLLVLTALALLLVALVWLSLAVGYGLEGWSISGDLVEWRWPRAFAALAAGILLACAGGTLQRMTGNPMASPEVLGVSAGAAFGLIIAMFALNEIGRTAQLGAATLGALLALLAMLALARGSAAAPERVLLVGIALGAMFDALVTALMAGGDPRALLLLNWMTGSTYGATATDAGVALVAAFASLAALPLLARWLDIVPLGGAISGALGLPPRRSNRVLLVVTAAMTAVATLVIGPLTFVGLMAPHLARFLGLQRALPQMVAAALIGGILMVAADWFGRTAAFPWQIPAGLTATFIGCPALMWLLARRQRA
ncbi:Fe(3+)-hydroxamate ABC transporter permease FhuB [Ancylobacter polymorphus]|uniref:Fe(3+)-hydroxamate ABC transporter permease FhuB n=1 Tax=Ancylobacter polymorphus TaxID=223390 RepID=A0A9E6ZUM0_9HYPH|nr:Fe(3+)-hydroxamate ABC transporter permease FhuB [Ancylobacter polymorphus]UOK70352.1 Fe(3+)-hydroxamate ABC transporter permease FhuB [Ancylobacter polymorphus]